MSGVFRAIIVCDGQGPHEPASGYIVAVGEDSVLALRTHAVTKRGWFTDIAPSGYARDLCPACADRRGRARAREAVPHAK